MIEKEISLEDVKRAEELYNVPMTKENILLMERHDIKGDGKIVEMMQHPEDSKRVMSITGYRVFAIYDNKSQRITQYDANNDSTDLSCLFDKEGYYLCEVVKNEFGKFLWACYRVGSVLDKEKGLVQILDVRECTEDESNIINDVFPEYFQNAY
jgi:hypothetical protein